MWMVIAKSQKAASMSTVRYRATTAAMSRSVTMETMNRVWRREYRLSINRNAIIIYSTVKYAMINSSTIPSVPPASNRPRLF